MIVIAPKAFGGDEVEVKDQAARPVLVDPPDEGGAYPATAEVDDLNIPDGLWTVGAAAILGTDYGGAKLAGLWTDEVVGFGATLEGEVVATTGTTPELDVEVRADVDDGGEAAGVDDVWVVLRDVLDQRHATCQLDRQKSSCDISPRGFDGHEMRITLPYGAFDLTARYCLAGISDLQSTQSYSPLKRATDPSQHCLGRTFLQEAYVTADYSDDARNFTVAPAQFPPNTATMNITTVYPAPRHRGDTGLSAGAIAGISIRAVVIMAILAGLGFCFWPKKNWKAKRLQN
ncbi:hypothetical protein LTR86_001071 [Recurvomyces mirabilis]|nr:hypothetical protein LTR86_001071 [Recurvomyces mirabilis]